MGLKTNIRLPKKIWSKADSIRLGLDLVASIRIRTSQGIDANGDPFKEYSTKKIYIPLKGVDS